MTRAILFGKLPTHGDFVARGIGSEQRDFLDQWLSASLMAARQQMGEDFEESYDKAPPCRYVQPDEGIATGGIVAASADSAGRRFPVLLALSGLSPDCAAAAAVGCENLIHDAFAGNWQADDLHRAASELPLPAAGPASSVEQGRWWTEGAEDLQPVEWRGRFPAGVLTMMLAGETGSDEFRR